MTEEKFCRSNALEAKFLGAQAEVLEYANYKMSALHQICFSNISKDLSDVKGFALSASLVDSGAIALFTRKDIHTASPIRGRCSDVPI